MGKDDPRPDKQERAGGADKPYPDTGSSPTHPAPGGVGTGTQGDPSEAHGAGTGDTKK